MEQSLQKKYPHIFDSFIRGFGMIPQCYWYVITEKKDWPAVDRLIEKLHPKTQESKSNKYPNKSLEKNFIEGMLI